MSVGPVGGGEGSFPWSVHFFLLNLSTGPCYLRSLQKEKERLAELIREDPEAPQFLQEKLAKATTLDAVIEVFEGFLGQITVSFEDLVWDMAIDDNFCSRLSKPSEPAGPDTGERTVEFNFTMPKLSSQ